MNRINKRIILSVLISLGVILAVFTSVQGASPNGAESKVGSHAVSGALVNLNHDRFTAAEKAEYNSKLDAYNDSTKDRGGGCERDLHSSPDL